MASDIVSLREYGLGKTQRRDAWWVGPLATALGLGRVRRLRDVSRGL